VIKSRGKRMMGHAACIEDMINIYKILVTISELKRPGSPLLRWEDNIEIDLVCGCGLIYLSQDRG
jgi:hypothetical protein